MRCYTSVVLSFLLLLYGTAGGAVYGMAKAAPAMVGRCRLALSKPVLKLESAHVVSA